MLRIEVFGDFATMEGVARRLDAYDGISRVTLVEATRSGHAVVSGAVRPAVADALIKELGRLGVEESMVTLTRLEVIGQIAAPAETSLVWIDVLASAWHNARPLARYLVFLLAAGIIACYGVLDLNSILIVGAMAVSPDLLPITSIGVGIVGRNADLALRAAGTLVLGMAVTAAVAALHTFILDQAQAIPTGFDLTNAASALGGLTTVSDETVIVAFVAGMAGMLALETRASSGVGVAVSVTTIPAAAYLGVAIGIGQASEALGAAAVLGMNVVMMALGASSALIVQTASRRSRARGG